ncbi:uncharacterized protein LOC135161150 isoform X1 [Diachasmimorpha longicaudata]|uniref:uncharacterized protein LOC135161150 isoform X1 n=1 Tax=Diachasmimorpha longicaudata TaxID=58733 RepID=UPI0030B890CC
MRVAVLRMRREWLPVELNMVSDLRRMASKIQEDKIFKHVIMNSIKGISLRLCVSSLTTDVTSSDSLRNFGGICISGTLQNTVLSTKLLSSDCIIGKEPKNTCEISQLK